VTITHRPTIAFDFSGLDHLNVGNGQYRYCADLLNGLAALGPDYDFIVLGSRPTAPPDVDGLFADSRWRYLHVPKWKFRGGFYLAHARLATLLQRHDIDLLHSPHTFLPLLGTTPVVVTIYDLMSELFPEYEARVASRPYRMFKHAVERRRPHIIAISKTTAQDLERLWHVPSDRITVVHLATGEKYGNAHSAHLEQHTARPFVLSPFNLEPRKNLSSLLRAMKLVLERRPDVRLLLYGRAAVTPDRERAFHHQVEVLGLQENIQLTGFVSDADLSYLYSRATVFAFPSLYEGFGLPVLEAMAAGSCTIVRDTSAMAEVLGDAGVQVDTADPTMLGQAIAALLDDAPRREKLGLAARHRAAGFTRSAMAKATLGVYARTLGRN